MLLIDEGVVAYDLERSALEAAPAAITLLPPHVPHDGRSAVGGKAFRKRVLYLSEEWLPANVADAAVTQPTIREPSAVATVTSIHSALRSRADALAAECSVLALQEIVRAHLGTPATSAGDAPLARRLREMLDDRLAESFTIAEAARILGAHPSHLVRAFSQAYGIAPYRYLTGRRVDRA